MSWIVSFRLCLSYPLNHGHQGCQVKRKVHSQLWPNLVFARNSPRQKYEKIYISRIDEMSSNFLNLFLSFLSKTCFKVVGSMCCCLESGILERCLSNLLFTLKLSIYVSSYLSNFLPNFLSNYSSIYLSNCIFQLSFKLSFEISFEFILTVSSFSFI